MCTSGRETRDTAYRQVGKIKQACDWRFSFKPSKTPFCQQQKTREAQQEALQPAAREDQSPVRQKRGRIVDEDGRRSRGRDRGSNGRLRVRQEQVRQPRGEASPAALPAPLRGGLCRWLSPAENPVARFLGPRDSHAHQTRPGHVHQPRGGVAKFQRPQRSHGPKNWP